MKMAKIQEKTFDIGDQRIKLVSFSVDPEYGWHAGAPRRLRREALPRRWRALALSSPARSATIQALVEGPFDDHSMQRDGTSRRRRAVEHRAPGLLPVLVDRHRHIRGIVYDSNDIQRLDEMIRDARYLARTRHLIRCRHAFDDLASTPRLVVVGIADPVLGRRVKLIRGSAGSIARGFGAQAARHRADRGRLWARARLELAVATDTALTNNTPIALGTVIGSCIANISLVLGITAVIRPPTIDGRIIRREVPVLLGSAIAVPVLLRNGELSRMLEGALLIACAIIFTIVTLTVSARLDPDDEDDWSRTWSAARERRRRDRARRELPGKTEAVRAARRS